jgi:D-aspartate ligase
MNFCTESELAEKLVPVVLGGDILAYSYARCFNEAYGIKTMVISGVDVKFTSSSRFTDYHIEPAMGEGDEAIAMMLRQLGAELAAAGKTAVLLGSADWHVRTISQHKEELEEWFVVPYNDFALLDDITQKGRFYAICEELGMAYPKTRLFDCSEADCDLVLDGFMFPLIAKPSNSACYDTMSFAGKEKVYEAKDADDLHRIFNLLHDAGYDKELVVQDFIPGDDDTIRSLTTYSVEGGRVAAVSGGQVILQDHSPERIGNPSCILLERSEQLIEDAKRFCEHVNYRGFANFDAKYDSRDGKFKFFEVNVRPGANTWYMTLGGVNFAKLIVDDFVLGCDLGYREAYEEGLYSLVPANVVRDFVPNVEVRKQALKLFSTGKAASPLNYGPDSMAHKFWAWVRGSRQYKKYDQYLGKAPDRR